MEKSFICVYDRVTQLILKVNRCLNCYKPDDLLLHALIKSYNVVTTELQACEERYMQHCMTIGSSDHLTCYSLRLISHKIQVLYGYARCL